MVALVPMYGVTGGKWRLNLNCVHFIDASVQVGIGPANFHLIGPGPGSISRYTDNFRPGLDPVIGPASFHLIGPGPGPGPVRRRIDNFGPGPDLGTDDLAKQSVHENDLGPSPGPGAPTSKLVGAPTILVPVPVHRLHL